MQTLALRYLHIEMRVIHRDLTPGNVLLQHVPPAAAVGGDSGGGSIVKLADFGLATVLDDKRGGDGEKTPGGGQGGGQSVVGTMLYACPEIVSTQAIILGPLKPRMSWIF